MRAAWMGRWSSRHNPADRDFYQRLLASRSRNSANRDAGPSNGASLTEGYFRLEDRLEGVWLSADPASDLLVFDDLGLFSTLEAIFATLGEVTFFRAIVSLPPCLDSSVTGGARPTPFLTSATTAEHSAAALVTEVPV